MESNTSEQCLQTGPINRGITPPSRTLLLQTARRDLRLCSSHFLLAPHLLPVGRQDEGKRKRRVFAAITSLFLAAAVIRHIYHRGGTVPCHSWECVHPSFFLSTSLPASRLPAGAWVVLAKSIKSDHLRGTSTCSPWKTDECFIPTWKVGPHKAPFPKAPPCSFVLSVARLGLFFSKATSF